MLPAITPITMHTTRLEAAAEQFERRREKEAVAGLEALFIHMMLREMRKTIPDNGGIFGKSAAMGTMEGMMDEYLAEELAKSGQIGIARLAEQQLTNQKGTAATDPEDVLEPLIAAKVAN